MRPKFYLIRSRLMKIFLGGFRFWMSAIGLTYVFFGYLAVVCSQDIVAPTNIVLDTNSKENPNLDFLLPPAGSQDKLEFGSNGILVKQFSEGGKKASNLGFKLKATSKSNFLFSIDFEVKKIAAPTIGWGQGLLIRFLTEDTQSPTLALGYVANRKMNGAICFASNHTESRKQEYEFEPFSFTKGTWQFERKDNELFVSIDESGVGSYRLVKRVPCTAAPLKEVQVWCTRQESGNTPSEYLLKRVQWVGDSYFDQPPPKPPFWTGERILSICFWLTITGGVAYVVQGVRSGKIPIRRR